MPYLMAGAVQAHSTNQPQPLAMLLEFPDDATSARSTGGPCLGGGLLVAPVSSRLS
jgi:alpha-glucosidase (family GH31 glycosyl hydrolase)